MIKVLLQISVEKIFGFSYLKQLYKKNYSDPDFNNNFWKKTLQILRIEHILKNAELIPKQGPCIIVSNHPFGILDGLIICSEVAKLRKDYRILINEELTTIDHIRDYLFPLRLDMSKDALKLNIKSKNDAIEFINKGGLVIIFPSGEVATSERLFNKAIEKEWKPIIGSIIRKVNCKILPVYCHGQNSFLFQLTGIINYKLRRILFARELINKSNKKFNAECGEVLDSQLFHKLENSQIAKNLRSETLKIVNLH
ncbi:COG3176 Putative hemolysin [Candidatus Pelagibacterales bacterium]